VLVFLELAEICSIKVIKFRKENILLVIHRHDITANFKHFKTLCFILYYIILYYIILYYISLFRIQ
jgi:hypothetical protein